MNEVVFCGKARIKISLHIIWLICDFRVYMSPLSDHLIVR